MSYKNRKRDDIKIQEYNYVKLTMILDEFLLQNGYSVEKVDNAYVLDLNNNSTPIARTTDEIHAYEIALTKVTQLKHIVYESVFTKQDFINKVLSEKERIK